MHQRMFYIWRQHQKSFDSPTIRVLPCKAVLGVASTCIANHELCQCVASRSIDTSNMHA